MNLLIHNAVIFTNDEQNNILNGYGVAVEGSRIHEVGPEAELKVKYRNYQQVDAAGKLLLPGLVNTHMHFYSTFARGLALPAAPKNFAEILKTLWWKLDSALDFEAVYYSALVPAITAVKNGVTAVIDHHASPNAISGSLDQIEEALNLVGLRGVLCYEISDRGGKEKSKQGLEENARYIRKCLKAKERDPDHLFDAMVGLHASFTLENETLHQAAELRRSLKKGCHIHVLEDPVDREKTEEKYKQGVVERLLGFGILGEKTIAAHAIHLGEKEFQLLAQSQVLVAHNPQSNMNNAVGRTNIFELLRRGVLVGLGTDGMSPDLKPDVRTSLLLHKHDSKDYNAGWDEIQQLTWKNNPAIFRKVSGQKVGRIESGYLADLILVDYYSPTPLTSESFWGHFLFGIADAVVDTTIINGVMVMRNKELPHIDEEKIAFEARQCAERVWERF